MLKPNDKNANLDTKELSQKRQLEISLYMLKHQNFFFLILDLHN